MRANAYIVEFFQAENVFSDPFAEEAPAAADRLTPAGAVRHVQFQLGQLAASMAMGECLVHEMELTVDGVPYSFHGDIISPEIVYGIQSLKEARDVTLYLRYEKQENFRLPHDPFTLANELENADEEIFDALSYGFYLVPDMEATEIGKLFGFYKQNGRVHRGVVRLQNLPIPATGSWRGVGLAAVLERIPCHRTEYPELLELLTGLERYISPNPDQYSQGELGSDTVAEYAGGCVTSYVHSIALNGAQEVTDYAEKLERLADWIREHTRDAWDSEDAEVFPMMLFSGKNGLQMLEIDPTCSPVGVWITEPIGK